MIELFIVVIIYAIIILALVITQKILLANQTKKALKEIYKDTIPFEIIYQENKKSPPNQLADPKTSLFYQFSREKSRRRRRVRRKR